MQYKVEKFIKKKIEKINIKVQNLYLMGVSEEKELLIKCKKNPPHYEADLYLA